MLATILTTGNVLHQNPKKTNRKNAPKSTNARKRNGIERLEVVTRAVAAIVTTTIVRTRVNLTRSGIIPRSTGEKTNIGERNILEGMTPTNPRSLPMTAIAAKIENAKSAVDAELKDEEVVRNRENI